MKKRSTLHVCLFAAAFTLFVVTTTTRPAFAQATNTFPSSGQVGIGTTSPSVLLHVFSAGSTYPRFQTSATCAGCGAGVEFLGGATNAHWSMGTNRGDLTANADDLYFYKNAGTTGVKMVLQDSGNVGIGTTSPGQLLDVVGGNARVSNSANTGFGLLNTATNGTAWWLISDTSGNFSYWNSTKGTYPFFLNGTNGDVGIGTTSPSYTLHVNGSVAGTSAYNNLSDIRFKKDVEPVSYGLDAVMKLRPIGFDWKDQDQDWKKRHQIGLVAQEVERVVPEVVTTADDAMQSKSIAYSSLVPVLIKAIQEQQAEINELKEKIGHGVTLAAAAVH